MFPINNYRFELPLEGPASFGAVRKHDIHTGVDLYCDNETLVFAIEDGIVVNIENFTGASAGSPWWNETNSILIEGESGVILYGELKPLRAIGETIKKGELIGFVVPVLKKDKGVNPTTMLHMELYKHGTTESVWWKLGEEKPDNLLNITPILQKYCQF
jgi:murein DD-endopeptidase MepM/ murein hydrolase activator NlpD